MSELWPEGQYTGSAVAAASGESKNGNPKVIVTLDFGASGSKTMTLTFAPGKAEEISTEQLKNLGWNGEFGHVKDGKCVFSNGTNREFYMKHDKYNPEKPYEKFNLSNPEMMSKPLSATGQASLGAKFRAKAGVTLKPTTGKPATPPAAKTKGPPPAAKAPAYGKAEAWKDWEAERGDKVTAEDWQEAVASFAKEESTFTEADWRKLGKMAEIPC